MVPIPFDVILDILRYTTTSELAVMTQTNKDLSGYALDRLYDHINHRNMAQACQTIAQNPSIAKRVRTLEIDHITHYPQRDSILPPLRDALACTTNLRRLALNIHGKHGWVFKGCLGVFKLESFSCGFYLDKDVLSFLSDQTELESLTFSHSLSAINFQLDASYLPKLTKVSAPMSWIDILVPNRPVSDVTITAIVFGKSPSSLQLSSSTVTRLQMPLHTFIYMPLPYVKSLSPVLRSLCLDASDNSSSTLKIMTWLRDLLPSLSSLRHFTLLGYRDPTDQPLSSFITEVTSQAPHLDKFSVTRADEEQIMLSWNRTKGGWLECSEQ